MRGGGLRRQRLFVVQVLAIVIGLLFVAGVAENLARRAAAAQLARSVQTYTGSPSLPEVRIGGVLFLPQVVRGAYQQVEVSTLGIRSGSLRIERVDSRLHDVRVPFHDVLLGDYRAIGVGASDERVTVRYADLNAYFRDTSRPLTLAPTADGKLALSGRVDVLRQRIDFSTEVELSVSDGQLTLTPGDIDTGTTDVNRSGRVLLGQRLRVTIPVTNLPFGHELVSARVQPDHLEIVVRGSEILLQP